MCNRLNHHAVRAFKAFLYFCAAVLSVAGIVSLFTGCATTEYVPATAGDTLLADAGLPARVRKAVYRGPVIIQQGTGNTAAVVGKDKTGERAQAVSTGANSPVTATERKGGVAWWVFLIVAVLGAAGWEYVSHQLKPLGWLAWRAKAG